MFNYCYRILPVVSVSPIPPCHSLPLGTWISGSGTTFGWLQDLLFTHLHDLVILRAQLI